MQPNFYEANKADGRAGAAYMCCNLLSKSLKNDECKFLNVLNPDDHK